MAELPKIDLKYLKEAFKEPINFWGMAGFAVAAAYVQDVTPLVAALATETLYLATVPASSLYRRLVDRREKQRLLKLREQQREAQIKLFDPREHVDPSMSEGESGGVGTLPALPVGRGAAPWHR